MQSGYIYRSSVVSASIKYANRLDNYPSFGTRFGAVRKLKPILDVLLVLGALVAWFFFDWTILLVILAAIVYFIFSAGLDFYRWLFHRVFRASQPPRYTLDREDWIRARNGVGSALLLFGWVILMSMRPDQMVTAIGALAFGFFVWVGILGWLHDRHLWDKNRYDLRIDRRDDR